MKKTQVWIFSLANILSFGQLSLAQDLSTTSGRVAPGAGLRMKSSGVPAYDLVDKKKGARVVTIPQLEVGTEPTLEFSQVAIDIPAAKKLDLSVFKKIPVPSIPMDKKLLQVPVVGPSKNAGKGVGAITATPVLKEILDPTTVSAEAAPVQVTSLTKGELKLIDALIFLDIHKHYGLAFGLLSELIAESKELRTEAAYHLGISAQGLGLYSEFRNQLLKVLRDKDSEWQKRAARALAMGAAPGDRDLVPILDPKVEEHKISLSGAHQYQLNRAKYYVDQENLTTALSALEQVPETATLAPEALFLKSVLTYRRGNLKEALSIQEKALANLEKNKPSSEFKSIIGLALARMRFQTGDYQAAFKNYLLVDKRHAEWPQAMIEQAWAQILSNDPEGAAGNMFTLHTDFLKHRFAPESYVVRTVGYLNLCQYGDGMKVLYDLKKRYEPIAGLMDDFAKKNPVDLYFYDTLREVVSKRNEKMINGLPRALIVDLARHPNFLSEQSLINDTEDQIAKLNGLTVSLIQAERDIIKKQTDIQGQLVEMRKTQKKNEFASEIENLERKIAGLKLQQTIAKRARDSIKDLRTQSLARMEKEKDLFKLRAGKALKARFLEMRETLAKTLDQSELLAYEVFSGAGEHLRQQLAGAESKDKGRLSVKAGDGKSVKWEFKGEIWEDELGHYRSSLTNVCSNDDRMPSSNGGASK